MKKIIIIIIAALLAASPAFAQQPQPTMSPAEQALGSKLLQELQSGVNCNTDLISLRSELSKAKAQIKEMEAKAETPIAPEPPK